MVNSNTKKIEEKLSRHVADILSVDAAKIKPDVPLHALGVDSLGFVELLVVIEKEFKIKLIESGITRDDFKNIRSMAKCITRALSVE